MNSQNSNQTVIALEENTDLGQKISLVRYHLIRKQVKRLNY